MLNRTIQTIQRQSFLLNNSQALQMAVRGATGSDYLNMGPPSRKKKKPAEIKRLRMIIRERKTLKNKSPHDLGQEVPPFFIPPRYKMMFKYIQ